MRVIDLDRGAVKQGLADGSLLLIDVREAHEYAAGHMPGALTHPLSEFDPQALAALIEGDARKPVFVCAAGVRSMHALHAAQQAGLPIEAHYRGGFKDWYAAGEAVE